MKSIISDKLSDELADAQNRLARENIPVLIVFEGGSGRVVSRMVNEISRALEPRFVSYHNIDADAKGALPWAQILKATPARGEVVLMDRSWYAVVVKRFSGGDLKDYAEKIKAFEEYLVDNGTRLIKIRLPVNAQTLERYADDYRPYTSLSGSFLCENKVDRVKFAHVMDDLVPLTDTDRCPWDTVPVEDVESTVNRVVEVIEDRFAETLSDKGWRIPGKHRLKDEYRNPRKRIPPVDDSRYKKRMEELSQELERLQVLLSLSDRSLVICFEGWDAAGKGVCIKHLTHALNPRGYRVDRVKKPNETEYAHTYMWRFADWVPAPGNITVFDRTWYGRMMVEPIEGFCSDEEYSRSAGEINMFEGFLADSGVIMIKFWLEVSAEEQQRRFDMRKTDPLKSWKFTDEDTRNQAKRDVYEEYIDRMISCTNTPYAPWVAVDSEVKKSAQLTVLETVVEALRKELSI